MSRRFLWLVVLVLIAGAGVWPRAETNVSLDPQTSPGTGRAGVHIVTLTGSGFPNGVIAAEGVTVTLRPRTGGPAVTTTASEVVQLPGSSRRITFRIPSSIKVTAPAEYLVTVSGKSSGGVVFSCANGSSLHVAPPSGGDRDDDGHRGDDHDHDHDHDKPPTNHAPVVSAGPNQTITLPASASLAGTATDDGLPYGSHLTTAWSKVSGPGTVTFAYPTRLVTTATFSEAGIYVLRLTASDSKLSASSDVTITVNPALPVNQPPVVSAGTNQTITLPAGAALNGTASDDGLPAGSTLTTAWSTVSGPGTVAFVNAAALVTTATFSQAGTYVLRLTASDSLLSASSDVTITVIPAPPVNQPPIVSAGANQTITLPSGAPLSGTATDDGLPAGSTLTTAWSTVSGPGTVAFVNAAALVTTATFSQAGTYVLRLTASDSQLSASSDVTITVNPVPPVNQPPVVSAGSSQTITLPAGAELSGMATDDGLPAGSTLTTAWSKVSGTGTVSFVNAAALVTTATFSQAGTYVLRLTASDSQLSASSDVTITVNPLVPVNQPPVVSAGTNQTITLPAGAVLTGTATDDGLPVGSALTTTWSKVSGAGDVSLANAAALATTATFSQAGTYVLRLTASDSQLSASSDITITVNPAVVVNQPPVVSVGSNQVITLPSAAALSGRATDDGNPAGAPLTMQWTQISGPALVSFANAADPLTIASFTQPGTYVLRFSASDSVLTASADITIMVKPENHPPAVIAGADQTIALPASASLNATVTDDGLPVGGTLTMSWIKVVGPGLVTFTAPTSPTTAVSFTTSGTYVLRLTATDSSLNTSSDVTVTVKPENHAPVVTTTADRSAITLPASVSLLGNVSDDGNPVDGSLTTIWTKVSGAGAVTFSLPMSRSTSAGFSAAGTYTLRLTANDSLLSGFADVTITVSPANQAPIVSAGSTQTITLPSDVSLTGTIADDGLPSGASVSAAWTKVSGPGTVTFSAPTTAITHAAFTAAGTYVLRLTASDTALSAFADVTITVNPTLNQPPIARAGGPYSGNTGQSIVFDGSQSSDPEHDALVYVWNFGDGSTGTGPAPTHTYTIADRFTVTLTVTDAKGGAASGSTIATIGQTNRPPIVSAGGPYAGDAGSPIAFTATASDPDGDTLTFGWTFGDGKSSGGSTPSHAFVTPGSYVVTLTVTDTHGASATATVNASVGAAADRAPPVVKLTAAKTALPGTHTVVTAAATDNVGIASVTFDVDGATSSQVATPPYVRQVDIPPVAAPGSTIKVRATARDPSGNSASDEAVITVVAAPDTIPPAVAIQLPPKASPGTTVIVSASAQDDAGVRQVTFATAGVVFATDVTAPYSASYLIPADTAPGSSLTFVARATDFSGNTADSSGVLPIVAAPDTTPPTVALVAPDSVVEGGLLHLTATATDDVQVASVSFLVDEVVVGTSVSGPYVVDYRFGRSAGAVMHVRALVKDSSNNEASSDLLTRVVAAHTAVPGAVRGTVYDDTTGLPLSGATVALTSVDASGQPYNVSATTDARGQYFVDASPGPASIAVTRANWSRVERAITIPDGAAVLATDARLTPRGGPAQAVTAVVGGTVTAGDASLTIAGGALQADASLQLTLVGAQGLEGLLPAGWSPIAAADVAPHGVAFSAPQPLSVPNATTVAEGRALVLATWDEDAGTWRAVATATAAARLTATVGASGQYAWLLADTVPITPPQPAIGEPVVGVARAEVPDGATADVTPKPQVIFYQPGANARVTGVLSGALSSGTLLRSKISESYRFKSGAEADPDPFFADFVFYQAPGAPSTTSGSFVVTPSLTFEAIDLQQGTITVDLRAPSGATAEPVIGPDGGTATLAAGESLAVPLGAFTARVPVNISPVTSDSLGFALPTGLSFIGAVSVGYAGATAALPGTLTIPRPGQVDESTPILLVRLAEIQGATRLLLVGVGHVVGTRIVSDRAVPGTSVLLPGVTVAGRYAFVRGTSPTGFVSGTVFNSTGGPAAGALLTTGTLPIVALSDPAGRYVVPVATGQGSVAARSLQTQDVASAIVSIVNAGDVAPADLRLVAIVPAVVSVTPADGTSSVALSRAIVTLFNEPIDPATLTGVAGSNVVVTAADGTVVAGTLSLSSSATSATFRATGLLSPNTAYTVSVSAAIKDPAGRSLAAPFTARFTTISTTKPAVPPPGSITATIPDASGTTTVTGAPGSAGVHDTVTVVDLTKHTFYPALVSANGSFVATFGVPLSSRLQVAITDPDGNQTTVDVPSFTRTNADGSIATVVGSAGGRVNGPSGIAVDVPASALPDGTILTVGAVRETGFPIGLTPDQKQFFGFGGGLTLDFGGATPTQYVNVSIPTTGGETSDDRWIVGQVATVGDQSILNIVDTARVIDGRITTSSPPCPGVQAAGTYGMFKSIQQLIGVAYGRFSNPNPDPFSSAMISISQTYLTLGAGVATTLPFSLLATPSSVDVCLPVLSGRVSVQPNSQRLHITADQFTPNDREIVIANQKTGRTLYYPRNVAEYRFRVAGASTDHYAVTIVTGGVERPVPFNVNLAAPGFVSVLLDVSAVNASITKVIVRNQSTTPPAQTEFPQSGAAVDVAVEGDTGDGYQVSIVMADGSSRTIPQPPFATVSPGNLVAKALPATIDPGTDVYLDLLNKADGTLIEHRLIPPDARKIDGIEYGGFVYPFTGNPAQQTYRVIVQYQDGRSPIAIAIPQVSYTISNPVTGRVIQTLDALAPPPDEPFNLGSVTGDKAPPIIVSAPGSLNSFDPSGLLSFAFSEGIDRQSALNGVVLLDGQNKRVSGQVRLSDSNQTVTFVPDAPLRMGAQYILQLNGLTDGSGNRMASTSFTISTFTPQPTGSTFTAGGVLQSMKYLTLFQKPATQGGTARTLGFGVATPVAARTDQSQFVVLDLTTADQPLVVSVTTMADIQRVAVVHVDNLSTFGSNPCGGGSTFSGDLAIVSAYTTGTGSAVRFFDVTNPAQPCMVGSKLLTINPANVGVGGSVGGGVSSVRADGAVQSELAFARGVAYLRDGVRLNAYIAVENVGLLKVDVGNAIGRLPTQEAREAMVSGNYVDVRAVGNFLLAIDRTRPGLDIFDGGLALVASSSLSLRAALSLGYADGLPFDVNGDGQIGQNEVFNLAFVGGTAGVDIVDVTNPTAPAVVGSVPISTTSGSGAVTTWTVWQVDVDAAKRRVFASAAPTATAGESAVFVIDLSGSSPFTLVDANNDGTDDRVAWRTPPGQYPLSVSNFRALTFNPATRTLYVGVTLDASGAGGVDRWSFDNICCDLSIDLSVDASAGVGAPNGDRDAALLRERKALEAGITAGLAAAASCKVPISTTTDAVKGSGQLSILEQGSGACLWRLLRPDGSIDSNACGQNYQPGLSDHDFEVFMPQVYFQGAIGSRPADCVVQKLSAQFVNDDSTPKEIVVGSDKITFDDITFFPFRKEGFDTARLDLELPQNKAGDTLGDLAMGRQQLLLLWLLGGDYVQLSQFNVKGEPLDSVMDSFKHVTKIPFLEGYEWANLQRFNLLKSKSFVRILGSSRPQSAFHGFYVKQMHDAAKAGIRAAFARMVADPDANSLVLDVRRTAASPDTGPSYRENACANLPTADPATWEFTRPCNGFEEYVLASAARSVKNGLKIFTASQVFTQIQKFWRVKADVPATPPDLGTETDADRFLADLTTFIGGADIPGGDVDPYGGVIAATRAAYDSTIVADPRASQRGVNLQKVHDKIAAAAKDLTLHVIPHVADRGFTSATQVEVSMYRGQGNGPGQRVRPIAPNSAAKPGEPVRIDVAHDTDAVLATGADLLPDSEFDDPSPEERNLNDLAEHEPNHKTPIFSLGDPRLKTRPGQAPDPNADPNNPLLDLKPSGVKWVAFTIDLPDRPATSQLHDANRQNNFDGFFYYVLDRVAPVTPGLTKVPFPGSDPSVLAPDPLCLPPPGLSVAQTITVRNSTFDEEATILPGEQTTLNFTVTNPSTRPATDVRVCSELTSQCYPVGTVAAGATTGTTRSYTAPAGSSFVRGLVTASSRETGVRVGNALFLSIGCETYEVVALDPDPNPASSSVEQGGKAHRYYRVIDRETGRPLPNAPVRAVVEVPGGAPIQLDFVTDADGIITSSKDPGGLVVAYPQTVPPGTKLNVRINEINGLAGYCAHDTTFPLALNERQISGVLSAGVSLAAEGKFEGYNLQTKGAFGLSGTLKSTLAGDKSFVLGRMVSNSGEVGFKIKGGGPSLTLGIEGSSGTASGAVGVTTALLTKDEHTFPSPLSTNDMLAVGALVASTAYAAPLSVIPAGPVLFRVLDEAFEQVTGLDASRTLVGISSALGVEANGALKSYSLTLGKADTVNGNVNSKLSINIGAKASADAAIVLSIDLLPKTTPPQLVAGIEYRGQAQWSVGADLALASTLAKPLAESLLTSQEVANKLTQTLDQVKSLLGTTGNLAGRLKFTVTVDADAVKLKAASVTVAQRKQYGYSFIGGTPVNQGDANLRSLTFRITDRDPVKLQLAVDQIVLLQAVLGGTAIAQVVAGPEVTDDFLAAQIATLISYSDEYERTLEQGNSTTLPVGLSRLLKGTPYEAGAKPEAGQPSSPLTSVSGELALNVDSVTTYTTERGAVRHAGMYALETYLDPDPLVQPTAGDKTVATVKQGVGLINTVTDNLKVITTVVQKATTRFEHHFSPSGVILDINGAAEPDSPDPFEVNLLAFKYTPVPGPLVPTVQLPADVGGTADQPHYGIGGFFQFTPEGRTLAAPAPLTIVYLDTEVASIDQSTLAIYRWNVQKGDWDFVGGTVDPVTHTVSTTINVLGLYTVGARMPSGAIVFTPQLASPINPQQQTTVTFTSGPIRMNTGELVPDGTSFTVYSLSPDSPTLSQLGTITTADADSLTDGVQVSSRSGAIQFTVTLPAGFTIPRVVGFATHGTAFGSQVIPLQ